MMDRKPPTWNEIRNLIEQVDRVCRESEFLRAHAERVMRRPTVWPDRRQPPRKHDRSESFDRHRDDSSGSKDGTL